MRTPRLLTVALLTLPLAVTLGVSAPVPKGRPSGEWPQWRGPNRDGVSLSKGLLTKWPAGGPRLLWSVEEPPDIGIGYGSVAVVDGRVFVLGADGGEKGGEEFCTCLRATDGSRLWRTKLGNLGGDADSRGSGPRATPAVDGEFVYVLGYHGELACLTAEKGEVKWKKNLVTDLGGEEPSFGYCESPLVDGGVVAVSPGPKVGMVALDKRTGKTAWECKEIADGAGYSSAVVVEVGGVRQFVRQWPKATVGVRAKDGKMLWKVAETERGSHAIPTPVVADGHVFITSGDTSGCECYKLEKDGDGTKATKVYAKNKVVANSLGGVIALGDKVYGHSDTGNQWVCFAFKTGGEALAWKDKGVGKGSVIAADGHLYCLGESDGTCALVKATDKEYAEVSRFALPGKSKLRPSDGRVWAQPAIARGRLFLRDYERLFAFDIAGP